ncbi:beta-1,3-glucanase family protein [Actinoplanes awajinensis]|uniref:Glucan endo-1,3-beta-D-glucosidase n=1 Tax=Actinoplanes awajinensis subsp. mycoplanecinus TaxID=135947 RepID=A0A117MPU0_9ACTN|nr:beta-1,3-glucanase family protein [Actinoplanes awajinensis]KUL29139.1 glucan endo-1,3-beta-D-glucosidase [Actinoplanes awajinensis subsp. mycoplanecinus]
MSTRSRLLSALAALVTAIPIGAVAAAPAAEAVGPNLLPFTVTNSTGRGDATYLYVIGVNLTTGRLGYVTAGGTFNAWPAGSLPPSPAPDVAIGGPGNGGNTTVQLPRNFSGRLYMSLGAKLKFFLTPDGLVQPAPWASGDPNHDILFDWSEFTYNDAGLWLNSSQVDMFAVPHVVTVSGSDGTKSTGAVVANGRQNVIDQIRAQSGWANTVVTRADGTVLRVLSPGKSADAGLLSSTYLDSYINSAWNAYASKTLTVVPFGDQPNTKYFGRTSGNTMVFTNTSGAQVASFNKPSSANVWGCDGNLGAPNDLVVGPIARTLCAALNRGTLGTIDTQPGGSAADFYKSNPTNQYARIIHANMADGKAYAFAFDDVQNQESLVYSSNPTSAGAILSPFVGGGGGGGGGGSTTGYAVTGPGGKCVDVAGDDNGANGTAVQLWDCQSGAKDQHWTLKNGTLQTLGRCLDLIGNGSAAGTQLELWDCNGVGGQQWVTQADGSLRNPQSGRCVDSPNASTANGARLQIWDCNGSAAQKFAYNGGATNLTTPGGKCADVAGDDNGGDGAVVQIWDCQLTARDQHWAWTGQSLTTLGMCLDIVGGGTTNGTQLQLHNCTSNAAQTWVVNSNGSISNPQSGRCLDAPNGSTANGTRLQIWDCNGSAAQKFAKA